MSITIVSGKTISAVTFSDTSITCNGTMIGNVYTCTLEYPVANFRALTNMNVTYESPALTEVYYILIGQYYGVSPTLWSTVEASGALAVVGSNSSSKILSGTAISIFGLYDKSLTYNVQLYTSDRNTDANAPKSGPLCKVDQITPNSVVCTVTSTPGVMGMFYPLVSYVDNSTKQNIYIPGTFGLSSMGISPAAPMITSVTGACATNSTLCTNGAIVTITGTNFNYVKPEYNKITFADDTTAPAAAGIELVPISATSTSLVCKLNVVDAALTGLYPIYIAAQICFMGMLTPKVFAGMLSIGAGQANPGWIKSVDSSYVDNLLPRSVKFGDTLAMSGSFVEGATYTVRFLTYAAATVSNDHATADGKHKSNHKLTHLLADGNAEDAPSSAASYACNSVAVTSTVLTCTVGVTGTASSMTGTVIVTNTPTNEILNVRRTTPTLTFVSTAPHISGASGACASDSTECKTGSVIVFSSSNFDPIMANNRVTASSKDVALAVTAVNSSSLTCLLNVSSNTSAVYTLSLQTMSSDKTWSAAVPAGYLVVNAGEHSPGWLSSDTTNLIVLDKIVNRTQKSSNTGLIAAVVVLCVLIIVLMAIFVCVCFRYQIVPRKNRQHLTAELEDLSRAHDALRDDITAPGQLIK